MDNSIIPVRGYPANSEKVERQRGGKNKSRSASVPDNSVRSTLRTSANVGKVASSFKELGWWDKVKTVVLSLVGTGNIIVGGLVLAGLLAIPGVNVVAAALIIVCGVLLCLLAYENLSRAKSEHALTEMIGCLERHALPEEPLKESDFTTTMVAGNRRPDAHYELRHSDSTDSFVIDETPYTRKHICCDPVDHGTLSGSPDSDSSVTGGYALGKNYLPRISSLESVKSLEEQITIKPFN